MLFCRSVVVVCKNMNATDVERLVPRLSLPGCNPKDSGKPQTPKYKGRCIELQNQRNKTAPSAAMAIADSSCRGKSQAYCTLNVSSLAALWSKTKYPTQNRGGVGGKI